MIVHLIKSQKMFSISLPRKKKGQYWLKDLDVHEETRNLISIEAMGDSWIVKSNKNVKLMQGNQPVPYMKIQAGVFIDLQIGNNVERASIYTELETEGMLEFTKYSVEQNCKLSIGRLGQNDISVSNHTYISGEHAVLSFQDGKWFLKDCKSRNGTFVNGVRAWDEQLYAGDYIFIVGLKIILGYNFLAINNPDGSLAVSKEKLKRMQEQELHPLENPDYGYENKEFFYKSPRFKREITQEEVTIDAPPSEEQIDKVPMALLLGPSITMGMASVSTASINVVNVMNTSGDFMRALPSVIMAGSMVLGSVFWPLLTKKSEKKRKIENEKVRQQKYLLYLNQVKDRILQLCHEQSEILNENAISVEDLISRVKTGNTKIWDRTIYQNDFLNLRLGIGNLPLQIKVNYPRKKFSMQEDNLEDYMIALGNEEKELKDVPITISLEDNFLLGVIGENITVFNFLKMLMIQMTTLFGYDELKIVMVTDEIHDREWEFMKIVPHLWNNEKTVRYLASTTDEIKELSAILEKEMADRADGCEKTENIPYYVIVCTSREALDKCFVLQKLMKYKNNSGFSIICAGKKLNDIPSEVKSVITLEKGCGKVFDKNDTSGKCQKFVPDMVNINELDKVSHILANMELDLAESQFALPNMLNFLEMFHVSKIEHLNPLLRWREHNAGISLQTPIGVDTTGDLFMLDLHENYHGPHGLVAGMTGSGKSEFIITYILSMAVNYHPDEVAFILIDYKGGGLADAFENREKGIKLPHLAGTITNLDGASINRALVSIESELKRRQRLFKVARQISDEGTMDIYKYQQLYRNNILKEPLPHLFIISDEFAELKSQQPEFMDQLISTARIGRSLGVHLILATQKPSGVVNEQIWSNSKFRVCLKVQEKADSEEMIKCPDAAELIQTGRFYLQVGFNELFALGQSAWCGADYIPKDTIEKNSDTSIRVIDKLGKTILSVKPDKKVDERKTAGKQIVQIVKYLSDLANEEKIDVRPLWLPMIPTEIFVEELEKKYHFKTEALELNPVIGEYDNSFEQSQGLLTVRLSREGNCIVYGAAGNGKTTFLTTLVYSLIKNYKPEQVNLYIMDFGSETLKVFENASHVGGVVIANESERVSNLFKMISEQLQFRKKLFSNYGGDYVSYCKNSGNLIPNIVVIINNFTVFGDEYENLIESLVVLTRECVKYGIYFVIATTTENTISYRISQNFKQIFTMRMNDSSEYSAIMSGTRGMVPMNCKGRGLVLLDRVYEFQTAYSTDEKDITAYLRNYCNEIASKYQKKAVPIPKMPDIVNAETVKEFVDGFSMIPCGFSRNSLKTIGFDFSEKSIYPVVADSEKAIRGFAEEFIKVLAASGIQTEVWDAYGFLKEQEHENYHYADTKFAEIVENCHANMLEKNKICVAVREEKAIEKALENYPSKMIFVLGIKKLMTYLDEQNKKCFTDMLKNVRKPYRTKFILLDISSNYAEYKNKDWFTAKMDMMNGLWIGDGAWNQSILQFNAKPVSMQAEISDKYGYFAHGGRPVPVKIITSIMEE